MSETNTIPAPPEPLELVLKGHNRLDGEPVVVGYACPKCGALFVVGGKSTELGAAQRRDDASKHCFRFCECGGPLKPGYYTKCDGCVQAAEDEKEAHRFDKAEKLSSDNYTDPVYWYGHSGGLGDGYFTSVEEVLEYCADEDAEPPAYVWACTPHTFKLLAEDILDRELERQDMFEGAYDLIKDAAKLEFQVFLDNWTKQADLVSWSSDYSRAVVITAE